ncbi:uncharacterized protein LOC144102180 [Amblyomma americanum]
MDDDPQTSALVYNASILLKEAFLGCSLLSAVELLQRQNLSPRRPVCITLCDVAYALCSVATVVILALLSVVAFNGPMRAAIDAAASVAVVWLICSTVCQRWKGLCASSLLCVLHGLYFVAALNDLMTFCKERLYDQCSTFMNHDRLAQKTTLNTMLTFAVSGSLLFSCLRSSPVTYKKSLEVNPAPNEETFSPCGKLFGTVAYR